MERFRPNLLSTSRYRLCLWLVRGIVLTGLFGIFASCGFNFTQGQSCLRTYECIPGLFCDRGVCIDVSKQGCKDNADCPSNTACRFDLCVPKQLLIECDQITKPCAQGLSCKSGYCTRNGEGSPCQVDNDCPDPTSLICDERFGNVCRVGKRCEVAEDCDQGFACVQRRCEIKVEEPSCSDSSDCPNEDFFCNSDGRCVLKE
ncbi:hypothetical protein L6R29_00325 [Myxococcota bacterium]|nr:hypothetical protein [Myxococcota bacterium]